MKIIAETERLILRHFLPEDDKALFELDSNPNVLTYLGTPPVQNIQVVQDMIERVQKEYETHGVGRVSVVLKDSAEMIGWAGLKYMTIPINNHINYYDVGYRFIERFWGNGYGYEAAKASLDYGLNDLKLDTIYAMAMTGNIASRRILEKIGMRHVEDVMYDGNMHCWFESPPKESHQ